MCSICASHVLDMCIIYSRYMCVSVFHTHAVCIPHVYKFNKCYIVQHVLLMYATHIPDECSVYYNCIQHIFVNVCSIDL